MKKYDWYDSFEFGQNSYSIAPTPKRKYDVYPLCGNDNSTPYNDGQGRKYDILDEELQ